MANDRDIFYKIKNRDRTDEEVYGFEYTVYLANEKVRVGVHKNKEGNYWVVTDIESGLMLGRSYRPTRENAVFDMLIDFGEKLYILQKTVSELRAERLKKIKELNDGHT